MDVCLEIYTKSTVKLFFRAPIDCYFYVRLNSSAKVSFLLNYDFIFRFLQRTRTSLVICTTQLKRQVIRERKIFSQFIIITTCFLVFDTSLIVISYLNNPSKWFGLFVSTTYILNCSVNGWVYLSMNQFIRGEVRRMFQRMLRKRNSKIDSDEYKVKQASVLEIV